MKLIMENWRRYVEEVEKEEEEEKLNEFALGGLEIGLIGAFAGMLLAPKKQVVHQEPGAINVDFSSIRGSLIGSSLGEILAMAGLGAMAKSGVGGKLKQMWNKIRGREEAGELESQLDDKEIIKIDPDKQAAFNQGVATSPAFADVVSKIAQMLEGGTGSAEELQKLVDKSNEILQSTAATVEGQPSGEQGGLAAAAGQILAILKPKVEAKVDEFLAAYKGGGPMQRDNLVNIVNQAFDELGKTGDVERTSLNKSLETASAIEIAKELVDEVAAEAETSAEEEVEQPEAEVGLEID